MKQAVTSWRDTLDTDFFQAGIQALASQWDKCLNVSCGCVEVWCVPPTVHVPSKAEYSSPSVQKMDRSWTLLLISLYVHNYKNGNDATPSWGKIWRLLEPNVTRTVINYTTTKPHFFSISA
jgi:hypothetical protein